MPKKLALLATAGLLAVACGGATATPTLQPASTPRTVNLDIAAGSIVGVHRQGDDSGQ